MTRLARLLLVAVLLVATLGVSAALLARRHQVPAVPRPEFPTVLLPEPNVPLRDLAHQAGLAVDPIPGGRLVVHKAALTLSFYAGDRRLKTYPIARGFGDLGDKGQRDDGRTPEGTLRIVQRVRQAQPTNWSDVWMRLDYPLPEDAERGLAAGLINRRQHDAIVSAHRRGVTPPQNTALGGGVGIHIGGPWPRQWTSGCLGLRREDGLEIYDQVRVGTTVTIGQ
ncbi:MAG TPA: L,D-transpeptidase [Armatimonadota bacterium]|jgi:hypothetical protein